MTTLKELSVREIPTARVISQFDNVVVTRSDSVTVITPDRLIISDDRGINYHRINQEDYLGAVEVVIKHTQQRAFVQNSAFMVEYGVEKLPLFLSQGAKND